MRGFSRLIIALMPAFFGTHGLEAQQWEKLPIYGSAFDQLEVSIFDSSLIVGYQDHGNVFFSTDGGVSWQVSVENPNGLWSWINDIVLAGDSTAYALTETGLWKSTDLGRSWVRNETAGISKAVFGSLTIALDGTIVLHSWHGEDGSRVLVSSDSAGSWVEILHETSYTDVFVDPHNSEVILVLTNSQAYSTIDGGVSWRSAVLAEHPYSSISIRYEHSGSVLGIMMGDKSPDPEIVHYYESRDTGRSWGRISTLGIERGSTSNCSVHSNNRIVHGSAGTLFANVCSSLYMSRDSGLVWSDANVRTDDIARSGGMLLGTLPPDGLVRWDDSEKRWVPYCMVPKWYGYEYAEYAHARGDTAFVLLSTAISRGQRTSEIKHSTDDGETWKTLMRKSGLNDLEIDASSETRYYLSALPEGGARAILTGRVDQTEPDTLYTCASMALLSASPRFPHHLYLRERDGNDWWLGYSKNGGKNWDWSGFEGVYAGLFLFASQLHPGTMLVGAPVRDDLFTRYAGLFLKSYELAHWEKVNNAEYAEYPKAIDRDDVLLSSSYGILECSTDYGRTWLRNDDGVDPGFTRFWIFNPAGRVIGTDYQYLYEFHSGSWRKLISADGTLLRIDSFFDVKDWYALSDYDLDIDDRYVHITLRRRGIYRARYIPDPTGVEQLLQSPRYYELEVYPQPVSGESVTISWDDDNSTIERIRIFDLHGRRVRTLQTDPYARSVIWNCRDAAGHHVQPGAYLIEMIRGSKTHRSMIIVQ